MYETIRHFGFYRELWAYRAFMVSLIMLATCAVMDESHRATSLGFAATACALALFAASGICSFFLHFKPKQDARYKKVLQAMAHDWKIQSWGILGLLFTNALLLCAYALWLDRTAGQSAHFSPLAIFSCVVLFFCLFFDGHRQ